MADGNGCNDEKNHYMCKILTTKHIKMGFRSAVNIVWLNNHHNVKVIIHQLHSQRYSIM